MRLTTKFLSASVLLYAAITSSALAAIPASPYSSLIVFGDSLSDPGNAAALTVLNPAPAFPQPLSFFPPTPNGHFSNGLTAAEVLAGRLGLTVAPGWPSAAGANNFAVGGAMTGAGNFNFAVNSPLGLATTAAYATVGVTGIQNQISAFQPSAAYGTSPLFMLQGGANDYFLGFALQNFGSPQDFQAITTTAVTNMAGNISALVAKGAKTIMVANLPDLGITPELLSIPGPVGPFPTFGSFASFLTNGYNTALANAVNSIDGALPADYKIFIVDSAAASRDAVANPGNYPGLTNVTQACLASPAAIGSNCTGYLFWDGVHPTELGHALFADQLYGAALAAAVPEPSEIAMMLVGLLLVVRVAKRKMG